MPTQRYAYEPFGKRRYTSGAYDANGAVVDDWNPAVNYGSARGFTGHEQLDDVGLLHMNGRIYDATLGVFLQADPHVGEPVNLQSYNRYAYVLNNPLNATDPSGFDLDAMGNNDGRPDPITTAGVSSGSKGDPVTLETVQVTGHRDNTPTDTVAAGPRNKKELGGTRPGVGKLALASKAAALTLVRVGPKVAAANSADETGFGLLVGLPALAWGGYEVVTSIAEAVSAESNDNGVAGQVSPPVNRADSATGGASPPPDDEDSSKRGLTQEDKKAIKSYEKRIAEHEQKLAEFKANPTVRPGMEGQPQEVIERQQAARIQHLETEIRTFRANIDKIMNGR